MNLAPLSLQYVTGHRQPRVYDNTERMQAYNATRPVVFANTTFLRREARNQSAPVGVVK